ncbi:Acyl-CoA synthetase (AMP-forming)/AMP-acid ligase II [Sphingomonas palmae]|uniref:Acyl-CoA synthetase (AMP-forming)/AMP-acid ligase II n=1 Tax=Sphingomonas palmae TaxID=1855283 RepID=A0A1H7HBZ2_9SPHN|nr:class I adenylate-forming enzyme family protein [Sphingomonas palmae]SEK47784.1 Acyl-CoA synthetase (AMP-forming)/AMP-acid ligase II [Sphingomonas palmae]
MSEEQDTASLLAQEFGTLSDLIRVHARRQPDKLAIADDETQVSYGELDRLMDRVAAALQHGGTRPGQAVASVAYPSVGQALVFLGALRAGAVAAPIQPSATPDQIAAMIADCGARTVFLDAANADALIEQRLAAEVVLLDHLEVWLASVDNEPQLVEVGPEDGFNIIYSSGTTGTPKGIVQSHAMRWQHLSRNAVAGFDTAVTLIATPLYSNTTLVSFLPTLGWGGSVVLMKKFDANAYLTLAERYRATHTMLVPVQYQRIMALPDFDRFDLSSFRFKTCTSAPFSAALKRDVVARWPGLLVEYYGMTEGGGTCALNASEHPDKLHTVGRPLPGHDIRLIDDDGREVAAGEMGEVVGRSGAMMSGYHGREQATADATWISPEGQRFIRHGDVGRFDADGFLTLTDRKKDMIISGGFNIFPSDIEAELAEHPAVADCTVVGVASEQWGETPVGFYVPRENAKTGTGEVLATVNARLGKTQRLSALYQCNELPRSAIGKVLKRELRDRLAAGDFA